MTEMMTSLTSSMFLLAGLQTWEIMTGSDKKSKVPPHQTKPVASWKHWWSARIVPQGENVALRGFTRCTRRSTRRTGVTDSWDSCCLCCLLSLVWCVFCLRWDRCGSKYPTQVVPEVVPGLKTSLGLQTLQNPKMIILPCCCHFLSFRFVILDLCWNFVIMLL